MPNNNMNPLLNQALICSEEAKKLLETRKFCESLEKSYLAIYSTVKAVAEKSSGVINPIDLLYETEQLVNQNNLDAVFYNALFKAIAQGERIAELPKESITKNDAQELFDFSIQILRKAREIYEAQKS